MKKMLEFMRKERLYLLLLLFIILVNTIVMTEGDGEKQRPAKTKTELKTSAVPETKGVEEKRQNTLFMKREQLEEALTKNKTLAALFGLVSLFITVILLLGIVIDILLTSLRMSKKSAEIHTYRPPPARWNIWDVARVVILFLFFGYMLVIIESLLLRVIPILKDDNFRMMVNTSILDTLAVVFIIYFTVNQYKEDLVSLGLSAKNFVKNVFYGLVGYIAAAPILVLILALVALVVQITKYVPETQPVVELFLKEENAPFLVYTSIFTAVLGPVIEELFFRAFMYNAFKKTIGIFWAMLITSAVFASLHTNIVGFFPIMALGVLLAYMYEKTGTLVSSITVHMLHNLNMVFLVFLMKQIKA
jgi:membrane protease YdiL (CAAX protease family)